MIKVCLGEWYNNPLLDNNKPIPPEEPEIDEDSAYISGSNEVYPFDICYYKIENACGGSWYVETKQAIITAQDPTSATIEIVTGRSGEFTLYYKQEDGTIISLPIKIKPF